MARRKVPYSGWRSPLGVVMGLTLLVLGLGTVLAVVGVQNQTSTQSEAARKKKNKKNHRSKLTAENATNPFVFSNPRVEVVGSGQCKLYVAANVKNTSSKKLNFTYSVELSSMQGNRLVAQTTLKTSIKPKQNRRIGAMLGPAGLFPGQEYNPRIVIHNYPDMPDRPNYRTMQGRPLPDSCTPG